MSKAKARVFVPLTKVDEEQRLVYGRITQEMLDKSTEVMDYASSKPLFETWSNEIHENSGGLSKGNVRVMHGLTAAGKLTELDFNDDDQAIDVCAKIVDDAEWNKVTEGVYTGFSVGGSYAKRWTETLGDGTKLKKYTAKPNEVSLVDNPCVPSATFSMFKADGSEVAVEFQVENDDEAWPDFAKVDDVVEETVEIKELTAEEQAAAAEAAKAPVEKAVVGAAAELRNEDIASKATELAKAADDGSAWIDHIDAAREMLLKAAADEKPAADAKDAKDKKAKGKSTDPADDSQAEADDKTAKADFSVTNQLSQKWVTTDGQTFDKKTEAEAHQEALTKAAQPKTAAEALKARLAKALTPEAPEVVAALMDDYDRLGKAVQALQTPWENGAPKLEKGMYTVSRFANVLWDLGSLTRRIATEGASEDNDSDDKKVSDEMKTALAALGESFKSYVDDQITELLAGIDDEVCVETYDYYYRAAQEDGENQLAKDVCSLITDRREAASERRETLSKAFGIVEVTTETTDDEMNPSLKKRFDALESENGELKKIAVEAVEAVETLTKRVEKMEETPEPPAIRSIAWRDGDNKFFGKVANTHEEQVAVLGDMLKTMGPDALATELIKASQRNPLPGMTRGQ